MAKRRTETKKQFDTGKAIETPSPFGSHQSMVVDSENFGLALDNDEVLCYTGDYYYVTKRNRLDTGLADPKRYSGEKLYF